MRYNLIGFVIFGIIAALAHQVRGDDALDEVNAARAARGLPAFERDEGLSKAAQAAASFRAENSIDGHTSNDFAFVPSGCSASAAGCAAWANGTGWGSCCTYEGYTHAGAAFTVRGGTRYMHLFVRGGGGGSTSEASSFSSRRGRRGRR